MRWRIASCALLVAGLAASAPVPEGVSLSQWVREDLFAGYMANSQEDFERGVAKLEEALRAAPNSGTALGWMASADLYRAVRALEAGDHAAYARLLKKAWDEFDRALASDPLHRVAVLATTGGMAVTLGDRLAPGDREKLWRKGRDSYVALLEMQRPNLEKMPPHFSGELLAGMAQLEQRLGNRGASLEFARETVTKLAGTPYEAPALAYLQNPANSEAPMLGCQSCHDRNRLANVLERAKQAGK